MDEVDIGVRLEEVAPGALARMRLAGDEEHAQLLADALDGDDGAIVGGGELAVERLGLDLDHVRAAVIDPHRQREWRAGAHLAAQNGLPVAAHGDEGGAGAAALHHLPADGLVAADDAEAGRLHEPDLAVALVGAAGDEGVQRGVEAEQLGRGRDVVDDAVGDEEHAGEPVGRHVGEGVGERREQAGAVVAFAVAGLDEARLDVGQGGEAALQVVAHPVGHGRALAERLRGGAVEHDRDDVLDALALLLDEGGIGEGGDEQRQRQGAHDRDRPARDQRQHDEDDRERGERPQHRIGNERREADGQH